VSGELYRSHYLTFSPAEFRERIQESAGLLIQQFGLPGIILGVIGLIVLGRLSRLYLLTIWTASVFTALALFYGAPDYAVYLIPMLLCFAIWIGLAGPASERSAPWKLGLGLLILSYFLARSFGFVSQVDASNDRRAEAFGREVLSAAPDGAILFAEGDRAVFTLWYFHFALGERPDLAVVASELLHFDWYQESLRAAYPSLVVPGPFPWPETLARANPTRAVCTVRNAEGAGITCSPGQPPP
jgi:hypothetical protein